MADEVIELDGIKYTYHRVNDDTATITAFAMNGQANIGGVLAIPYDAARAMFSGLRAAANYRRIARNQPKPRGPDAAETSPD